MERGQHPLSYVNDHETGSFREQAVGYEVRSGSKACLEGMSDLWPPLAAAGSAKCRLHDSIRATSSAPYLARQYHPSCAMLVRHATFAWTMNPNRSFPDSPRKRRTPSQTYVGVGRYRRITPMITTTKNNSTMPWTMELDASARSAGRFRKDWITSTNTLRYSETSAVSA